MKKLQSLENFKNSGLSLQSMSKLCGGTAPQPTGAGCCTVSTNVSASGCATYTSDSPDGAWLYGYKDVNDCD